MGVGGRKKLSKAARFQSTLPPHPTMDRRHFLSSAILAAIAPVLAQEKRAPRIVLRSSWQTVNIGDIAHTPGVLHLLEQHLPEAEIRLWPSSVSNGVDEMLMK